MDRSAVPAWLDTKPELLYDREEVSSGLDRVAAELSAALAEAQPLVLCLMSGGVVTAGLLLPRLELPLELDYLHIERYRGGREGGAVHWVRMPPSAVCGRTVLLVDDILDEGVTLAAAVHACNERGARQVFCMVLVDKQIRRPRPVETDYAAFKVPDRFIVGCGMDYRGYLRNLPGIYALP